MPWSEIVAVTVTLLMVRSWRRWRRSGRVAPNSQRFSRSSQLTEQKRNLLDSADAGDVAHLSRCEHCKAEAPVPMRRTRLERRPWRIVWWCAVCGRQSRALVPPELVPTMVGWDTAYGTSLSLREVVEFATVDVDELGQAVEDELL